MAKLNRKERLRKQARHEERVARWKVRNSERAAMEAENVAAFEALPEIEKHIVGAITVFGQQMAAREVLFPRQAFFQHFGITALEERRVVYSIWNTSVFDLSGRPTRALLAGLVAIHSATLNGEPHKDLFLKLIERLTAKIPGFSFRIVEEEDFEVELPNKMGGGSLLYENVELLELMYAPQGEAIPSEVSS